jgi:hypothetical protein
MLSKAEASQDGPDQPPFAQLSVQPFASLCMGQELAEAFSFLCIGQDSACFPSSALQEQFIPGLPEPPWL